MPAFPDVTVRIDSDLTLDSFTHADVSALLDAVADDELRRWLPLPDPYTRDVAEAWCTRVTPDLRESGRGLVLALRHQGALAGCIDAKRVDWRAMTTELGYWTAIAHRGRGLMPAAVDAFSRWLLREQQFERVELRIAPGNHGSVRVAEKSGFTREGVARNAGFTDHGRVDLVIFSRVPNDLGAASGLFDSP